MGPLLGCGGGESYFHEFLVLSLAAALHDQANTAVGDPARAAADSAIGKFKASSRPFTSRDWIVQLDNLFGWLCRALVGLQRPFRRSGGHATFRLGGDPTARR